MSLARATIAIPTCNRENYLREALDSALEQTYENLEVIVSDNCSDDGTAEYLRSVSDPRLVVLQQSTNLGMIGNWEACLERATGEYFLLLSDDDTLDRDAIRSLVSAIENAEEPDKVAFAYCRSLVVDQNGSPLSLDSVAPSYEPSSGLVLGFFSRRRMIRPCATLLRTQDIREVGGYKQGSVRLAVDAIVWSRVLQKRAIAASVGRPLARYRVHTGNLSTLQSIEAWQTDLWEFSRIWIEAFKSAEPKFRRRLLAATRGHHAWVISITINQAERFYPGRLRLFPTYYHCRASFVGVPGLANLAIGLIELVVPEVVKKPIRDFLVWKQRRNDS